MASYQSEREEFVARMTREGLDLHAIHTLLRCATTINRLAELACSSEAADRDRINCPAAEWIQLGEGRTHPERRAKTHPDYPCLCDDGGQPNEPGYTQPVHSSIPRIRLQDWQAEQRAIRAVPDGWRIITEGDPRGYTLRVIPPSYAERNAGKDRHNLDAIGVPPGPSRLRW